MNLIKLLEKRKYITPPKFLSDSIQYLVTVGSHAYGIETIDSDIDIYGWCIPPKEIIFPHTDGNIYEYDKFEIFNQYQQQVHPNNNNIEKGIRPIQHDITVFSIIKLFILLKQNNPNMIGFLYVPENCIRLITKIGKIVRDNRDIFLHKGAYHRYKGYAFAQLKKATNTNRTGKRKEIVDKYKFDVKYAMHLVRLINECEQILTYQTIDLQRDKEMLKSIRRGEWTFEQIQKYFEFKNKILENLYYSSPLPDYPNKKEIKIVLVNCLEEYFGNLSKFGYYKKKYGSFMNLIKKYIKFRK